MRCLTPEGRQWAIENLGPLALDAVPPEITGAAVQAHRDSLRHIVENAETEAHTAGKAFTPKDHATVIETARATAIRMATQPEAA